MENILKSHVNRDLWCSVAEKVRQVDGGECIAAGVEAGLIASYAKDGSVGGGNRAALQQNLLEALDTLHESLATSKPALHAVRQAYLALCLALLHAEAEHSGRVRVAVARGLEMLASLPRPLHNHLSQLQDVVRGVHKAAMLMRGRAKAMHSGGARLLLLADQTLSGLHLLLAAVRELEVALPSTQHTRAGVLYVLSRLRCCLEEASGVSCEELEEPGAQCGQFVLRMDEALGVLEGLDPSSAGLEEAVRPSQEQLERVQQLCEDLLGHAMSVAHVALGNDASDISQVCQKVLGKAQVLQDKEDQAAMLGLRLGSLADALLTLEQTVNTSLLRLVLEVFSDVNGPLDRLLAAEGKDQVEARVAAFDLHVDRIMQAGMFAVACSSDTARVAGVRSCLASLESLEPELVPTILARQSAGKPGGGALLAEFYAQHWRGEAGRLEHLLDQLVDPAAYCQVTAEELARRQETISRLAGLDPQSKESVQAVVICVEEMVRNGRKLLSLISSLSSQGERLGCDPQAVLDLGFYTVELGAAIGQAQNPKWMRRVVQRARLLTNSVRALSTQMHETISEGKQQPSSVGLKNGSSCLDTRGPLEDEEDDEQVENGARMLHFPESVRDLPLDISATPQRVPAAPMFDLTPFLARGKQLCDARSVLYRTPLATPGSTRLVRARSESPQRAAGVVCVMGESEEGMEAPAPRQLFVQDEEEGEGQAQDNSMNLNITDILEGLSNLSETLNSEPSELVQAPITRGGKIGASLRLRRPVNPVQAASQESIMTSQGGPMSTLMASPSLGSQAVSVSEREKDLHFLQDKIDKLKRASAETSS